MKQIHLLGALLMTLALGIPAQAQVQLAEDYPDSYVVQPGDTLWDIAGEFLQQPWMWPEIWYANEQVANPHLIYPGDVLRLVFVDGRPMLTREAGTVKLSPEVREIADFEAIPAIDLSAIREFLKGNRVFDGATLEAAPYMVAGESKRVIVGGGDLLYARGDFDDNTLVYGVYRVGAPYIDPETGDNLGVRALELAMVREEEISGDIGRFHVARSSQEMTAGDRLLPYEDELFDPVFYPAPPASPVEGLIMAVEGNVAYGGALDILALNRGSEDGLQPGNVLSILQAGETVRDRVQGDLVTLPDFKVGLVMVFKTYPRMSYGIILESSKDVTVGDTVASP